jgi:hypothetical protein
MIRRLIFLPIEFSKADCVIDSKSICQSFDDFAEQQSAVPVWLTPNCQRSTWIACLVCKLTQSTHSRWEDMLSFVNMLIAVSLETKLCLASPASLGASALTPEKLSCSDLCTFFNFRVFLQLLFLLHACKLSSSSLVCMICTLSSWCFVALEILLLLSLFFWFRIVLGLRLFTSTPFKA